MNSRKLDYLSLLALLAAVLATVLLFNSLQEPMMNPLKSDKVFFGGSKTIYCTIFLMLILLFAGCAQRSALSEQDPKYEQERMIRFLFRFGAVSLTFCYVYLLWKATGAEADSKKMLTILLAVMMMLVGSQIPYTRPGNAIGFRFAWTLSSEECWRATHTYMGHSSYGFGLVQIILILIQGNAAIALAFGMCLWVFSTFVYSFVWAKKHPSLPR